MKIADFTKEQALPKIKQFCAYQERCLAEVREKLYSFSLQKAEAAEIIAQLKEENYLNEERFAIEFAGGKFRLKKWGKVKIRYALKQKQVNVSAIKTGLTQIADIDYKTTLRKLAEQKLKSLTGETNPFNKQRKLHDYLLQKGYESIVIQEVAIKGIKEKF